MLTKLVSREERNRETHHPSYSIERSKMLPRRGESVQRAKLSRTSAVFEVQLASETSDELGDTALDWQCATQKEQAPCLYCFNVGAKRPWGRRQLEAKISQTVFSGSVRCVGGHD